VGEVECICVWCQKRGRINEILAPFWRFETTLCPSCLYEWETINFIPTTNPHWDFLTEVKINA